MTICGERPADAFLVWTLGVIADIVGRSAAVGSPIRLMDMIPARD